MLTIRFRIFDCLDAFLHVSDIWLLKIKSESIVIPKSLTFSSQGILFPFK